MKKKKTKSLELIRQTRSRDWGINPVLKVIPNKKAERNKKLCRGKDDE